VDGYAAPQLHTHDGKTARHEPCRSAAFFSPSDT
jgi:hypothetical protein